MKINRALMVLPAMLGMLLFAGPAEAQYYGGGGYGYGPPPPRPAFGYRHRIHGYVGAQLTGIGVLAQSAENAGYLGPGGGGGGLFGGVRLGPFFALELNWNITYHNVMEDYVGHYGDYWSAFHLQTIELNGKIHIPTRGAIEPFIQLGAGFAFLGVSWDDRYYNTYSESGDYVFTSGFTFNVGGGLDVWLSPFVSLGGRVLYKGMRFGEPQFNSGGKAKYTNFANAINVDLNVTLHF
jgi:hypothetical protein